MDRNEIFQHFKMVLDDLIDHSVLFKTYLQCPRYLSEGVYGGGYGIPANISMFTGVTRACIVDNNFDWVVKFDIDEDRYGSACEREERIYKYAEKENLQNYFSEVIYLGTYKKAFNFYPYYNVEQWADLEDRESVGAFEKAFFKYKNEFSSVQHIVVEFPLYGYRRINAESPINYKMATKKEVTQIKKFRSPLTEKTFSVAVEFFREYGEKEYQKLSDFLIKNDINDIHGGNVGYIDEKIIIIDYAGYYDPDEEEEEEENNWSY